MSILSGWCTSNVDGVGIVCRTWLAPQRSLEPQSSYHMLRSVVVVIMLSVGAALQLPVSPPQEESISRRRVAMLGVLPLLTSPLMAQADEVLHIIGYPKQGSCGEALVPDKAIPFVKAFGGFSDGSCASVGYETEEGTQNGTGDKDKERAYTIYGK